jgi:hypothetical protein
VDLRRGCCGDDRNNIYLDLVASIKKKGGSTKACTQMVYGILDYVSHHLHSGGIYGNLFPVDPQYFVSITLMHAKENNEKRNMSKKAKHACNDYATMITV